MSHLESRNTRGEACDNKEIYGKIKAENTMFWFLGKFYLRKCSLLLEIQLADEYGMGLTDYLLRPC